MRLTITYPCPECESEIEPTGDVVSEVTCSCCGTQLYFVPDGDGETSVDEQRVVWRDRSKWVRKDAPITGRCARCRRNTTFARNQEGEVLSECCSARKVEDGE